MRKSTKKLNDPKITKKLMTVLNRLMGLRPFDDRKGQPRMFLSSPYVLVLWSLLSGTAVFVNRFEFSNQKLIIYLSFFCSYLYVGNCVCLTFLGYHYSKAFVLYEKKMLKVDESLRTLGVPPECRGSIARSKILIIAWFSQMVFTFVVPLKAILSLLGVLVGLYVNCSCCYVMNIGSLVLLDFIICVGSVKDRYEKVNDLLASYATDGLQIQDKKHSSRALPSEIPLSSIILVRPRPNLTLLESLARTEEPWKYAKGRNWRLQAIRLVHLELCRASNMLSEIFGAQVALEIRLAVIYISIALYYIYINVNQSRFGITSTLPNAALGINCMFGFVKLFFLSRTCEYASRQANKASTIVHSCYPFVTDTRTKDEIRQFAMQLSHCLQDYTMRYISRLNYSLLTKCVSAISTNLVVMVQMGQLLLPKYSPTVVNNSIANASIGS